MPDPIPRPTRLRPVFAFLGARKFDRFFAMIFLANSAGGIEFRPTRVVSISSEFSQFLVHSCDAASNSITVNYESLNTSFPESAPGAERSSPCRGLDSLSTRSTI